MQKALKELFLKQIDAAIAHQKVMREKGQFDDLSGLPPWEYERFNTTAIAAIERVAGSDSLYAQRAIAASKPAGVRPDHFSSFRTVLGILESVREAVAQDYLDRASELIHASLFADFLEMAQHLLDEGYKDAAAVIAGSALEAHMRQLCAKNGVGITVTTGSGAVPKKADRMNADLTGAKVYSVLDQKNVTAWLDLRNKAAHGEYSKYQPEQVFLLISGVRDFMSRNPA